MGLTSTLLESVCSVQRPTVGRAADRSTTQDPYRTVRANLPCSVQEASARVVNLYAQRNASVDTTVYFALDPGAEPNDRLVATNRRTGETVTLLVQGESQSGTHGRTWTVPCVRIRAPKLSAPPLPLQVAPPAGTPGTSVRIVGSGFAAGATVLFGSTPATGVTVVSSSSITCTAPAGTGTASIRVTNPDGQVGLLAAAFRYVASGLVLEDGSGYLLLEDGSGHLLLE